MPVVTIKLAGSLSREQKRKIAEEIPKDTPGRGLTVDEHHTHVALPRVDGMADTEAARRAAQAVIAKPHPTGRAAMRMLEEEGFYYENYIDIFDGGPTMMADTDQIRTLREAKELTVSAVGREGEEKMLLACGRLQDFAACYGYVTRTEDEVALSAETAELLGVQVGDRLLAVER